MNENIRKVLSNIEGFISIEVITYIAVAAIIASIAIPKFNDAFDIRNTAVRNNFNSTDTIIE